MLNFSNHRRCILYRHLHLDMNFLRYRLHTALHSYSELYNSGLIFVAWHGNRVLGVTHNISNTYATNSESWKSWKMSLYCTSCDMTILFHLTTISSMKMPWIQIQCQCLSPWWPIGVFWSRFSAGSQFFKKIHQQKTCRVLRESCFFH